MIKKGIIITDCDHEDVDIEKTIFAKASIPFELKQCKTEEDLIEQCQNASVLINQYAPMTRKVLDHLPELKMIVRYGVGVNNIDVKAASEYGVQICNVPDYGVDEVADHALAMMLHFTRKIGWMNKSVRKGEWQYEKSIPIFRHSEQTVGVIGVGRIGGSFARKVHHLGCNVLGYDSKYQSENVKDIPEYIESVSLDTLLEKSDVISIHCPLDDAHHLIGEAELKKMKGSAFLINVSRGGLISEKALSKALKEGWISGAAIDVAEEEPLKRDSSLLEYENFVCTPHMAWYSEQAAQELKCKVAEEAIRFLKGEKVNYPVN